MIGIIICCCYKYLDNFKECFERWKEFHTNQLIKFFYVFGSSNKIIYDPETFVLQLDVPDDYECLPQKICKAIDYIYNNHPEITGIFKTDDDIEFNNMRELILEITTLSESCNDYAGIFIDTSKPNLIHSQRLAKFTKIHNNITYFYDGAKYCYGAGYFISRQSAKYICENKKFISERYLEDVTIGHVLNKYNIFPTQMYSKCREVPRNV